MNNNMSDEKNQKQNYFLSPIENEILFYPQTHSYILKSDPKMKLTSATETLKNLLFGKFDPSKLYRSNTLEEIAMFSSWMSASQLGTLVHSLIEDLMVINVDKKWANLDSSTWYKNICDQEAFALLEEALTSEEGGGGGGGDSHDANLLPVTNNNCAIALALHKKIVSMSKYYAKGERNLPVTDLYHTMLGFLQSETWSKWVHSALSLFKGFLHKESLLSNYTILCPEFIVYDKEWKIAGCIDLIMWADKKRRHVVVVDWKTNRRNLDGDRYPIRLRSSPFFGKRMNHREEYECQLHLYSEILQRQYNVIVIETIIVHIYGESVTLYRSPFNKNCCLCIQYFYKTFKK